MADVNELLDLAETAEALGRSDMAKELYAKVKEFLDKQVEDERINPSKALSLADINELMQHLR